MPRNYETATVYSSLSPPDDPFIFVDCTWTSDDAGTLHIFRAVPSGGGDQVASFGARTNWMVHANAEVQR